MHKSLQEIRERAYNFYIFTYKFYYENIDIW